MSMFGAVDLSTLAPKAGASGAPDAPSAAPAASHQPPDGGVPAPLVVDVTAGNLRDVAEVSTQVPVVLVLYTRRSEPSTKVAALAERLAQDYAGRFELGLVDVDAAPEVAQALQATAVPCALALVSGQPLPVFQGTVEETQLRGLLDRVLQVAASHGVNGHLALDGDAEAAREPEETEVERQAREAVERGDYAAAEEVYKHAIAQDPTNESLQVARDQVRLMARLDGQDPHALLAAADADPADVEAALAGADAALALGDVDAALGRALEAVRSHQGDERERARLRLLEIFALVGTTSPRVARARRQLATMLY